MAMWGFGSMYDGKTEMLDKFITNNCICIGWKEDEAPALHQMLKKVKTSDWVYIKSMNKAKGKLLIKAIGVVTDDTILNYGFGKGISVKWLWHLQSTLEINLTTPIYKNNVFNNTLYEEYNSFIQNEVLNTIFPSNQTNI